MAILTDTDQFNELRTLASQLHLCSLNEHSDVKCVMLINEITPDCEKIRELLYTVFAMSSADPEPELSLALSNLVEACEISISNLISDCDKLEDVCQWALIFKALHDSYLAHNSMWTDSKWPRELKVNLEDYLGGREESDATRKALLELPEFCNFLNIEEPELKYQKFIDQVVEEMYGLDPVFAQQAVSHAIEFKPDNYKFSIAFFDKLFHLEESFFYRYGVAKDEEYVRNFYSFEFFAYQNAEDHRGVCQHYTNLGRFSKEWVAMRIDAAREVYNVYCWLIVNHMINNTNEKKFDEETDQLFNWLCVLWPNSNLSKDHRNKSYRF